VLLVLLLIGRLRLRLGHWRMALTGVAVAGLLVGGVLMVREGSSNRPLSSSFEDIALQIRHRRAQEAAGAASQLRPDAEIAPGTSPGIPTAEATSDEPLVAGHPEIPKRLALQGFAGVRAYESRKGASHQFLTETLGFTSSEVTSFESRGELRGSYYVYDAAPEARSLSGSGTVHHVAWSSPITDHEAWRDRVIEGGGSPTPVIDRFYFRSIYFREPSGVLFEIATKGPGFTSDEPKEHLGEKLSLPPDFEHLRAQVEANLTPLPNLRAHAASRKTGTG